MLLYSLQATSFPGDLLPVVPLVNSDWPIGVRVLGVRPGVRVLRVKVGVGVSGVKLGVRV